MREVRVTLPKAKAADAARLALQLGMPHVSVYDVFVLGPNEPRQVVSVETSTPTAKKFIEQVLAAPFFNDRDCTITARTVRAILSAEDSAEVTKPVMQPAAEVNQELWQSSHVTASYLARNLVATALAAYGMLHGEFILLVTGLLFSSYLPGLLGVAFGLTTRQPRLVGRMAGLLTVGTALAVMAGALTALAGPQSSLATLSMPSANLLLSLLVGVAAGLATGDDVGERQLIGLAAATQYAKFPVWLGIGLVLGFAEDGTAVLTGLGIFAANAALMVAAAAITYRCAGMHASGCGRPAVGHGA